MQVNWTVWAALLLALALLIAMFFRFLRKRSRRTLAQARVMSTPEVKRLQEGIPERISIGEAPDRPIATIAILPSAQEYEMAKPLEDQSNTSISRLSALCGALPSLLVAGQAPGKCLMEVVIYGDLVRAADGNGLRAFTMSKNRIEQHARLYEVSNLQNVINATAIWQIASIVVAQKHLADISIKLDEIKDGIHGISKFLNDQRRSRIQATYVFLGQAYQAIQAGEFPGAIRNQLEDCERDLLEIQYHLETDYREKVAKKIEHKEWIGTENLTADIAAKLDELDMLTKDIAFCVRVRIAAWHVLSLFPGEQQLKLARRESIQESIKTFQSLGPDCEEKVKHEISNVYSFWVSKDTLEKRRKELDDKCDLTVQKLAQMTRQGLAAMEHSDQLMLENDRPTRILFQFDNGALVGARQG